jgi:hypothetical protein
VLGGGASERRWPRWRVFASAHSIACLLLPACHHHHHHRCQAAKLQRQGWTLVDVRLASEFDAVSAAGSINVPMYR